MKKRILSVCAAVIMIFSSFTAVHCEDDIKVLVDGQKIEFDVPPQIIDDYTFVPMRAIFEALGAEVQWFGKTQTITASKDTTNIEMTIASNEMFVGKDKVMLDVPPQIVNGRTLVPVRAVAESFKCQVDWDGATRTVSIH